MTHISCPLNVHPSFDQNLFTRALNSLFHNLSLFFLFVLIRFNKPFLKCALHRFNYLAMFSFTNFCFSHVPFCLFHRHWFFLRNLSPSLKHCTLYTHTTTVFLGFLHRMLSFTFELYYSTVKLSWSCQDPQSFCNFLNPLVQVSSFSHNYSYCSVSVDQISNQHPSFLLFHLSLYNILLHNIKCKKNTLTVLHKSTKKKSFLFVKKKKKH